MSLTNRLYIRIVWGHDFRRDGVIRPECVYHPMTSGHFVWGVDSHVCFGTVQFCMFVSTCFKKSTEDKTHETPKRRTP
jgi:hypothetical protein